MPLELPPLSQAGTMRVSRTGLEQSARLVERQAVPPEKSTICGKRPSAIPFLRNYGAML
jgi:hypothetical protein